MANVDDSTVTRIDAGTGKVIGRPTAVSGSPTSVVVGQDGVWAAYRDTIVRIDAHTGQVVGSPVVVPNVSAPTGAG